MNRAELFGEDDSRMDEIWSMLTDDSFMPMAAGVGPAHEIRHVNPAFCRLVGKPREELIGHPFSEVVSDGDECLLALDRVSRTGVGEKHTEVEKPEPHPLFWSYVMWPLRSIESQSAGVVIQVTETAVLHHQISAVNEALLVAALREQEALETAAARNIHLNVELVGLKEKHDELLQLEGDMRSLSETLEQSVRDRTTELMSTHERLQAFSYLIAHDLRQQIRGMNIHAHLVLDEADSALSQSAKDRLHGLIDASKLLASLVDDLLAYAHVGSRQPRRVSVDLSGLARRSADQMKTPYPEATFEIQGGMVAEGDPAMLSLVIENLIDNACKFSGEVANPRIHVGRAGSEFYVRDNGIGFDMAYADKVWEPLERLNPRANAGSGIGLAIVRRVVERHGGRVRVETEHGKGSTFFFSLGD
jgi:signal transduction histidine kinase